MQWLLASNIKLCENFATFLVPKKSLKGRIFPRAGRAASWDFPQASPSGNPSEQPCKPFKNPVHSSSFTQFIPLSASIERLNNVYKLRFS